MKMIGRIKFTLERNLQRNECDFSTHFNGPWSHIAGLWLDPDTARMTWLYLGQVAGHQVENLDGPEDLDGQMGYRQDEQFATLVWSDRR